MTTTHIIKAIRANIKLGWDQEGNWAPPLVYLLFALIAPVAGVLMLVFMYLVILGESREIGFLAFFLTGAAVFMYVRLILQGACFAVVEDREHYRMLRYMYIAPVPFPVQILGRIMVKLVIGTVGVLVTFLAGSLILDVPFRPDGIDWVGVAGGLFIGLLGAMAIGWMLSSMMLLVDRMGILAGLYAIGWAAYVGGGFGVGVHSVIEPAAHCIPVMFGPNHYVSNEATLLLKAGGGFVVQTASDVEQLWREWLENPEKYRIAADAADSVVSSREGVVDRLLEKLKPYIHSDYGNP